MKTTADIAALLVAEADRGERVHGPHPTMHHSAAVLREEFDELWDEVKRDDLERAKFEAVQVGAMAIRFLRESERWGKPVPKRRSK